MIPSHDVMIPPNDAMMIIRGVAGSEGLTLLGSSKSAHQATYPLYHNRRLHVALCELVMVAPLHVVKENVCVCIYLYMQLPLWC